MDSETLLGNMSLPREQKKSQMPWHDLALFVGALAFLGYSLRAFLGGATHSGVPAPPPSLEPATVAAAPKPDRVPASQATPSGGSTAVLELPCLRDNGAGLASHARLVQIHSPFCGDDVRHGDAAWHAANQTSGEEILVFVNRKEKTIATSYFSLKDGRNELLFTQDMGAGKTRSVKVVVSRKEP